MFRWWVPPPPVAEVSDALVLCRDLLKVHHSWKIPTPRFGLEPSSGRNFRPGSGVHKRRGHPTPLRGGAGGVCPGPLSPLLRHLSVERISIIAGIAYSTISHWQWTWSSGRCLKLLLRYSACDENKWICCLFSRGSRPLRTPPTHRSPRNVEVDVIPWGTRSCCSLL